MHVSLVQFVSQALVPVSIFFLEAAILVFLIRRKRRSEIPMFFNYIVFNMFQAMALAIVQRGSAHQYFYVYWSIMAVGIIFNFLVLYEIFVNALKPYSAVIDLAKMLAGWAAAFLLVTGVLTAFAAGGSHATEVCSAIALIERSIQLMQCGVLLLMGLFGSRLGLSWRAQGMSVALGLGVTSAVGMVESYLQAHLTQFATTLSMIDGLLWVSVVTLWAYTAARPESVRASAQSSPTRLILQRWNEALISYQQGDLAFASSSVEHFLPSVEKTVERVMARKMMN